MDGRTVQEEPVRDHGDRAGADPGDRDRPAPDIQKSADQPDQYHFRQDHIGKFGDLR